MLEEKSGWEHVQSISASNHPEQTVSRDTVKICHLTSVHERYDIRIFLKQCRSLAKAGHDVTLVVADGRGAEIREGVRIVDAGKRATSRPLRMTLTARKVLAAARSTGSTIFHLHDPELIPVGLQLKRDGARVIFDSHEDYITDILTKPYLKFGTARLVSVLYDRFERSALAAFDGVVSAYDAIANSYHERGINSQVINNYPIEEEISLVPRPSVRPGLVCYTGAITTIRGVPNLIDAMAHCRTPVKLLLVGPFTEKRAEESCKSSKGWERVEAFGLLNRQAMREQMDRCLAGLVTFLPVANHVAAQPNKLFEYMAAGLAVIGADFPLWKEIIEGEGCGICVDPTDPEAIAAAIDRLNAEPELARMMGEAGRQAVLKRYNWNAEAEKLQAFYATL